MENKTRFFLTNTKKRVSLVSYPWDESSKEHLKGRRGLEGALEGGEGSKAHSKGSEGSKARSKRKRELKGALEKEARALRRPRKKVRTRNVLKKSEGSKAHSKEVRAWRRTQKRGRVRKRTTLDGQGLEGALERKWGLEGALKMMIEGSKAHSKKWYEKHRDFLGGLILMGSLPKLKIFQKQFHFLAISSWPSTWWIPQKFLLWNLQNSLSNVSKFRWYACIFT